MHSLDSAKGALPNECHKIKANSGTCSLFLLSSSSAASRELPFISSAIQPRTRRFSSLMPLSMTALLGPCSALMGVAEAEALLLAAMRP